MANNKDNDVLIIAEIGMNFAGDINLAKKLIHLAKENGADIAKFQVYDVDKIFTQDFEWYDYVKSTELTKEQIKLLIDECRDIGIEFLASVFDIERVDWLEELGVKRYKIASRSINDKQLIDTICDTDKDIIVSLGMWDKDEFPNINTKGKVDYLYCISKYPTYESDIDWDKVDFTKYSGFSDHTIGLSVTKKMIDRGARIIEKHFTLDKEMYGPDHKGSMNPSELKELYEYISNNTS